MIHHIFKKRSFFFAQAQFCAAFLLKFEKAINARTCLRLFHIVLAVLLVD
jgi:hypothetical protein